MSKVSLTDRWISAKRPPPSGRISVVDALCKNLHLRISCHGTKTFSVMLRIDGRLCRRTLGEYPALKLSVARKEALRLQREAADAKQGVQVAASLPPIQPPAAAPAAITYAALVTSYTDLHLRPNTRAGESGSKIFEQEVMKPFMARAAASISRAELVAVLDRVVADGKPHGAENLRKSLHAMFAWAVSRDTLPSNPCAGVRPPVRGNQRDRVLTDAEIVAVLGACDKVPAPFGAMVRVLILTGARRCEVAEMRWRELEGNVWTLPAARSKNGRANVLPLPPAVMAVLNSMPRYGGDNDYVFTTTRGKRPSSNFGKRKVILDSVSGTSGWRLHDLRRVWRTRASQLGVSREVARRVVGHSVDTLDSRYDQHDYRAEKAAALVLVAEHIAELVAAKHT